MSTHNAHSEKTKTVPVLYKEVHQMERCLVCSSDCKMKSCLPKLLQGKNKYKWGDQMSCFAETGFVYVQLPQSSY